jgi:hypothetical protein
MAKLLLETGDESFVAFSIIALLRDSFEPRLNAFVSRRSGKTAVS